MKRDRVSSEERVRELRRDFDGAFALPRREGRSEVESFLAIRLAGNSYALRLADLAAIAARPRISPLPSGRSELLGLIGHRGRLAALFSLPLLLGYPRLGLNPRWYVLPRQAPTLALGFDEYDGHVRVAGEDLQSVGDSVRRRFVSRVLRQGGMLRLVVDLPALVADLAGQARDKK